MLFARPRGGLQLGKGLRMIPKLRRESVGCPAKILFISDLHLRPEHPEMADTLIKVCTGTEPDLVCLGGDMAEYDEWLENFRRQTGRELEIMNPDENPGFCETYDVVEYPTILALGTNGEVRASWRGRTLPLINEVLYYII